MHYASLAHTKVMKKQLRLKNLLYFFMKGPCINICDNYVFKSGKEIRLI